MLLIVGLVVVVAAVVGGYLMAGGSLLVLLQPSEFVVIDRGSRPDAPQSPEVAERYIVVRGPCYLALRSLVASGAQLRPFSQDILEAAYNASMDTYKELTASNAGFKKIFDSQRAFLKDAYLWAQISEYTFDTFMMIQQRAGKL